MKSRLKRTLIGTGSVIIVLGGAWAGATKLGYIPNWLGLEILCPCGEDTQCDVGIEVSEYSDIDLVGCYGGDCLGNFLMIDTSNGLDKPIIYLYPEETTEVNVKLGKPENIVHTYPKYVDGWDVIANPDGTLIDTTNGRSFYALYWEGINDESSEITEGFVVKGEDIIPFLEEKLATLGLNEREAEEFIVYWLPILENNKWNLIRFRTIEEINKIMPLDITPVPDTVIRVLMQYKPLDEYQEIPEQKLITSERNGFTVVEWGGEANNIVK